MPSITISRVGCSPFFYLHFWNSKTKVWVQYSAATHPFVKTWDSSTGSLIVNTADFATYDNVDVLTRITSLLTQSSFEDQFTISFRDKCRDATLTTGLSLTALDGTSRSSTNPFTWHMWQFAQANFNQIVVSATPTACPVVYSVTDVDYDRTPIDSSIMVIDTTAAAPSYQVQAVFREVQTRFFIVRAVVSNVNNSIVVLKSEAKYYVKVTNPCLLANQVIPQTLADIDYWIKDLASTQTISAFHDYTTDTYGN